MEAQKEAEGKQSAAAARKEVLRCGSSALGQLVPPLLQLCSEAAQLHLQSAPAKGLRGVMGGSSGAAAGKLSIVERSIFLLNCIDTISQALSAHATDVVTEHLAGLQAPSQTLARDHHTPPGHRGRAPA